MAMSSLSQGCSIKRLPVWAPSDISGWVSTGLDGNVLGHSFGFAHGETRSGYHVEVFWVQDPGHWASSEQEAWVNRWITSLSERCNVLQVESNLPRVISDVVEVLAIMHGVGSRWEAVRSQDAVVLKFRSEVSCAKVPWAPTVLSFGHGIVASVQQTIAVSRWARWSCTVSVFRTKVARRRGAERRECAGTYPISSEQNV